MKKLWMLCVALSLFASPALARSEIDPDVLYSAKGQNKVPKLPGCYGELFAKPDCAPKECDVPHPVVKNFTVRHKVFGLRDGGGCLYVQTMPCKSDEPCYLECHYSTETLRLKKAAIDRQMRTGEVPTTDEAITQAEAKECAVHGFGKPNLPATDMPAANMPEANMPTVSLPAMPEAPVQPAPSAVDLPAAPALIEQPTN